MPRKLIIALVVTLTSGLPILAQSPSQPPKQTARQALVEMFLGKGPDDFVKHLPEETRRTLIHKGDTPEASWPLRFAMIGRQFNSPSEHWETFDVGPTLLVINEGGGHERIEVLVEHDTFTGESDEIELSVQYYKDGQPVALPIIPRFIFTLAQEKEIWRLTEITAAAHIPLTDPDYLKGLRERQNEQNETTALMRFSMIAGAETQYAAKHPDQGFACTLQSLFAREQTSASEAADSDQFDQGNEEWNGYRFTISACEGSPTSKYRVTAVPLDDDANMKTFCADESGVIKFIAGGKPSSCFSHGQPLNPGAAPESITE